MLQDILLQLLPFRNCQKEWSECIIYYVYTHETLLAVVKVNFDDVVKLPSAMKTKDLSSVKLEAAYSYQRNINGASSSLCEDLWTFVERWSFGKYFWCCSLNENVLTGSTIRMLFVNIRFMFVLCPVTIRQMRSC